MGEKDVFSIIWGSGASMCVSFDKNDVVGSILKVRLGTTMKGITNGLRMEAVGRVLCTVRHLKLPAYYVAKLTQRLLSTTLFNKV